MDIDELLRDLAIPQGEDQYRDASLEYALDRVMDAWEKASNDPRELERLRGIAEASEYVDDAYRLGEMYEERLDFEQAERYFRRASDADHFDASFRVGRVLHLRAGLPGVSREESEALLGEAASWYEEAAEDGISRAWLFLGDLYRESNRFVEAERCYKLAEDDGVTEAKERIKALHDQKPALTNEELLEVGYSSDFRQGGTEGSEQPGEFSNTVDKGKTFEPGLLSPSPCVLRPDKPILLHAAGIDFVSPEEVLLQLKIAGRSEVECFSLSWAGLRLSTLHADPNMRVLVFLNRCINQRPFSASSLIYPSEGSADTLQYWEDRVSLPLSFSHLGTHELLSKWTQLLTGPKDLPLAPNLCRQASQVSEKRTDPVVADIMISITAVATVSSKEPLSHALDLALRTGQRTLPVRSSSQDEIVGVVRLDDLARKLRDSKGFSSIQRVADLCQPGLQVTADTAVAELMREFSAHNTDLALVINPDGQVQEVATLAGAVSRHKVDAGADEIPGSQPPASPSRSSSFVIRPSGIAVPC